MSKIRIKLKALLYEFNPKKTNNHKLHPNLPLSQSTLKEQTVNLLLRPLSPYHAPFV